MRSHLLRSYWSGIRILSPETSVADPCYGETGRAPMDPGGGVAVSSDPSHLSHSIPGTDPSKHYISVYRSLAAIWILLGLAWLALVLPLGPLLLHRCSQLWLLSRGLRLKEGGVPEANGLPRPQKISTSA